MGANPREKRREPRWGIREDKASDTHKYARIQPRSKYTAKYTTKYTGYSTSWRVATWLATSHLWSARPPRCHLRARARPRLLRRRYGAGRPRTCACRACRRASCCGRGEQARHMCVHEIDWRRPLLCRVSVAPRPQACKYTEIRVNPAQVQIHKKQTSHLGRVSTG